MQNVFGTSQFVAVRFTNPAAAEVFMNSLKLSMDFVGCPDSESVTLLRKGYHTTARLQQDDENLWSVQMTTFQKEQKTCSPVQVAS